MGRRLLSRAFSPLLIFATLVVLLHLHAPVNLAKGQAALQECEQGCPVCAQTRSGAVLDDPPSLPLPIEARAPFLLPSRAIIASRNEAPSQIRGPPAAI
jgi:hypothetical protein